MRVELATPEQLGLVAGALGLGEGLVGVMLMYGRGPEDSGVGLELGAQAGGAQEMAKTLARVEGKLDVVLEDYREAKTAKERLQQMAAAGLLKFVKRVDARSIKVACAVLAKGDLAKAARAAGLKYSTMRDLIAGWAARGKDYAILADLVRWRKQMRFRGTVALDETLLKDETAGTDHAAVLSDVLEGLLEMTEENWEEKCEMLTALLRSALK